MILIIGTAILWFAAGYWLGMRTSHNRCVKETISHCVHDTAARARARLSPEAFEAFRDAMCKGEVTQEELDGLR